VRKEGIDPRNLPVKLWWNIIKLNNNIIKNNFDVQIFYRKIWSNATCTWF
jgi:hypothetical protein